MADTTLERFIQEPIRCKHADGQYCTLKARNGFCRRSLMMCGDDSIKYMDQFTKFKLNQIIKLEVKDKNE